MPIQMLVRITAGSAQFVLLSHGTASKPTARRPALSTPWSWSNIHRQTAPLTTSGSSHGSRSSDRSSALPRKRPLKNTASARPMANWKTIDPAVNSTVSSAAVENSGLLSTAE
jgi:hypothetical protein